MMVSGAPQGAIYVDIVAKPRHGWRIIGICPEQVCASGSLHVYAGSNARVVDSTTDELIVAGRSLDEVLTKLAAKTGMRVVLSDETTWEEREFAPPLVPS